MQDAGVFGEKLQEDAGMAAADIYINQVVVIHICFCMCVCVSVCV